MIKFDGKHWIGKKFWDQDLEIKGYDHVADIARRNLGKGGIVAIPNARPDDTRFEEFIDIGNPFLFDYCYKSVFHDPFKDLYFVKAQEINTYLDDIPLTLMVYGLPYGRGSNFDDWPAQNVLETAAVNNLPVGIVGPSCVDNLERAVDADVKLLNSIDFFVGYSGSAAIRKDQNFRSLAFYEHYCKLGLFTNPYTGEGHDIGVIAVSGGHRTPSSGFWKTICGQTIGTSYTELLSPSEDKFIENLKTELQNSKKENLNMNPIIAETVLRHIPSIKIGDKFRRRKS